MVDMMLAPPAEAGGYSGVLYNTSSAEVQIPSGAGNTLDKRRRGAWYLAIQSLPGLAARESGGGGAVAFARPPDAANAAAATSPRDLRLIPAAVGLPGFHCATMRAAKVAGLPLPLLPRASTRWEASRSCEKNRARTASAERELTDMTPARRSTSASTVSPGALSILPTFAGSVDTTARNPSATAEGDGEERDRPWLLLVKGNMPHSSSFPVFRGPGEGSSGWNGETYHARGATPPSPPGPRAAAASSAACRGWASS